MQIQKSKVGQKEVNKERKWKTSRMDGNKGRREDSLSFWAAGLKAPC